MTRTFIQVLAVVLAVESAYFLARSAGGMTPDAIVALSTTHWDYSGAAIDNLAQQVADARGGMVLLVLGIVLQMVNTLWPMRFQDFEVSRSGVLLAVVVGLMLGGATLVVVHRSVRGMEQRVRHILEEPAMGPAK